MSKLKRRKTAVEEIKSEQQFRIKDQNESLRIPDAALHRRAAGSPAGGGSSCWTSSDLSDVEKLWMKTLQALCPQVSAPDSALCVPRLPQLSTKQEEECERRWCSLDEDVIPFPNPLPHSSPFPSSPDLQNRAGRVPVRSTSSHERSGVSESEQEANGAAAGKPGSGPEHSGPECEGEAGTLDNSEIKSGSDPEGDDEARTSERGSGSDRLRLECCPMCLMPFPAQFSQMECDGHLAQCLSEMNADVMW
ncbi:hypothetical protein PDJAM_G00236860 [Pangasius djambal]|uniref:Uncharacterized protein n=1 Tax=Pangasius djambal TaxID=1691987 RepID=A0ACC5YFK2_9TELE|nr:hypothetical protein [Pangasius djambal]